MMPHSAQEWADRTGCSVHMDMLSKDNDIYVGNVCIGEDMIAPMKREDYNYTRPDTEGIHLYSAADWALWLDREIVISPEKWGDAKKVFYYVYSGKYQYDITEFIGIHRT